MELSGTIPWTISLCLFGLVAAGYFLYRVALPKPIEGIPYNSHAVHRILGDVPDAMKYRKDTHEVFGFLEEQLVKHNTPIFQFFMRPFGKPWVVISDFRETQDILSRRTREFDRSDFFGDLFHGIVPYNQVHMPTGDEWRSHRKLMADTMSVSFLNGVAAPRIYETTQQLISFWREKVRLAQNHPFDVHKDLYKAGLDVIWAATFGSDIGVTKNQLECLRGIERLDGPTGTDMAFMFPTAADPEDFTAIMTLAESVEIPMSSPMPRIHHKMALRFLPSLASATKMKDKLIKEHINRSGLKFSEAKADDTRCALDLIIRREILIAGKEGRAPAYDTQVIKDELGALKYLTAYQAVQGKLRSSLRAEFKAAYDAGEVPSVQDIACSNLAYLDATIEEIHRQPYRVA
ncbi:hypothetical protein LTR91_012646 [Friedmanniomyces endolithicus]|uniref:Cytochrome P450 n=1 Tax=Friedmanniomyces endolithicus TaxID=329885 RepID=A0AAN6KEX4_9PEZI|nr:hypothetical protein LTS09_004872 [Friedmanniomyces endolithicus]KAK0284831.1 hypothetical protein LTR35_005745 [Friedmanniomyces endolithicus]KAK0297773.1 hypothetical protein LTS00_003906 [Friedmanniomyces endolithicus]KAK0312775.1 hypothetical protein LTR01_002437 [Friedmanniomyces endolithicus]KAK0827490.1 hypothetical protein LTR73_005729 [Friedmanniomyces endolithicus]